MAELVSQLASIHGKPVQAHTVSLQAAQVPAGWTRSAVADVVAMWADYDRHGLVGNPNVLRMLLGRTPTGFLDARTRELEVVKRGGGGTRAPART